MDRSDSPAIVNLLCGAWHNFNLVVRRAALPATFYGWDLR
jgi:hypothetical protein